MILAANDERFYRCNAGSSVGYECDLPVGHCVDHGAIADAQEIASCAAKEEVEKSTQSTTRTGLDYCFAQDIHRDNTFNATSHSPRNLSNSSTASGQWSRYDTCPDMHHEVSADGVHQMESQFSRNFDISSPCNTYGEAWSPESYRAAPLTHSDFPRVVFPQPRVARGGLNLREKYSRKLSKA